MSQPFMLFCQKQTQKRHNNKYGLSAFIFVIVLATIVSQFWNEVSVLSNVFAKQGSSSSSSSSSNSISWEQHTTRRSIGTKTTAVEDDARLPLPPPLPPPHDGLLSEQALEFVKSRQEAFKEAGLSWRWRGLGYLYLNHDMILAATLPTTNPTTTTTTTTTSVTTSATTTTSTANHPVQLLTVGETHSVTIYNVHPNATTKSNKNNCHDFTLWVRVRGPEMIAERARSVSMSSSSSSSSCYWTFDFDVTTPGEYSVDAKLLLYASKNRTITSNIAQQCRSQLPNITKPEDLVTATSSLSSSLNAGFQGFKLYFPHIDCCEFCTRLYPHCIYWASPAFWIETPKFANNGCEFFFRNDTPTDLIPKTRLLSLSQKPNNNNNNNNNNINNNTTNTSRTTIRWELSSSQVQFLHGRPHQVNLPVQNYIGCGWSSFYTLDFPCLSGDLDDKIFMINNKFTAVGVDERSDISTDDGVSSKNNNNNNDLMTNMSKHNDDNTTTRTTTTNLILHDQDTSSSSPLPSHRPNGGSLPLCTVDTELADRSKGRWVRHALPNATTSCPKGMKTDQNHSSRFDIIEHDPDHPHCWHREVLKTIGDTCREANCKFIDRSSMYTSDFKQQHDETNYWYGVWRQDSCDYLEFTDRQLQQCIDKRKISNITMVGTSIASFLSEYLSQRLQHIQFYDNNPNNNNTDEARFVKVSTLGLVHYCHDPDETFRTKLPTRAAKKGDKQENDHNTEVYIVTGPFASSERETHVHADRIDEMNRVVQEILGPKGYNFLEFFDLSAAFTYAASTQMDGMHIVGPPMKMIITKLFHYMCKDFVEGSIV